MICCAVVDTNVLVSALLSKKDDAATVQIFNKVISGEIVPVYSNLITREYREVLTRKKFGFSVDLVEYLISTIEKYGIWVDPIASGITLPDIKDLPFYEVVLSKQDEGLYLLTGNMKHFPSKPFIVTANKFLEILNKSKK